MHTLNDEVVAAQQRVSSSHLLPSSLAFAFSSLCSSLAFTFASFFPCLCLLFPSLFPAFVFSSLRSSLAFAFSSLPFSLPSSLAFAYPSFRFPCLPFPFLICFPYRSPCLSFSTCLALICRQPHHACSCAGMHMLYASITLARMPDDGYKCIAAQCLQHICWVFNMCKDGISLSIHCCFACHS